MKSEMVKSGTSAGALSRLTLGTVQFGLPYGVANQAGQPPYETARDILACAIEGGVTCLDTAAGYGESESVLGRALAELGAAERVSVVTKVAALADDLSPARADALVEESVRNSLRHLRLECLPFCLFHREQDFRYADSLLKLRSRGLVERVGCSTTTPVATRTIIGSELAEAVQFPASVLDRRFTGAEVAGAARSRGMVVFARSVYLQGLVLLPDATTPENLREVIPARRRLAELARAAGIPLAELALRYVLGLGDLTSILVGVESVDQMRENLALFAKGPLPPDLMQAVVAAAPSLSDAILDPWRWERRMPDTKPKA
jgi:aryl-alcohol dehydrogenase-like predicted oxidoreductase